MQRDLRTALVPTAIAVFALAASLVGASAASAHTGGQRHHAHYTYLIGTGFIAGIDPPVPVHGPTIARAPTGDTVEITGTGRLSIHPKAVTGQGTFTHKDPTGRVLGSGTWTATQLLSFQRYGSGAAQGIPPQNEGGRALIRVHLVEPGLHAILWVDCLLGSPPSGAHEGVRLAVPGALNFNQEVSGETLFIRE